jgi:hypothetical protein
MRLRDPIQAALARKRRQRYPPDLFNGHDALFAPMVPTVGTPADRIRAEWAALVPNQAVPMVDLLTGHVERGYYEELPWDE